MEELIILKSLASGFPAKNFQALPNLSHRLCRLRGSILLNAKSISLNFSMIRSVN